MDKKVYILYHPNDERYKAEFVKYLSPYSLQIWDDSKIKPGEPIEQRRKHEFIQARLIIVLLSADLIASKIFTKLEGVKESKYIIPIILRPCPWQATWIKKYKVLPDKRRSIVVNQIFDDKVCQEVVSSIYFVPALKHQPNQNQNALPIRDSKVWKLGLLLFILVTSIAYYFYIQKDSNQQIRYDYGCPFFNDSSYHILLLPFYDPYGDRKEVIENAIYDRITFLTQKESLDIFTRFYIKNQTKTFSKLDINRQLLEEIDNACNSDLNIWGNYEVPTNSDSSLINIKYYSRNQYDERLLFENEKANAHQTGVRKIKDVLILSEGEITATIEDIVFWAFGIMEFRMGNYLSAIKRFSKMKNISNSINKAKQFSAIAECYLFMSDFENALYYYNKSLNENPTYLPAINNKAKILIGLNQLDSAVSLLNNINVQLIFANDTSYLNIIVFNRNLLNEIYADSLSVKETIEFKKIEIFTEPTTLEVESVEEDSIYFDSSSFERLYELPNKLFVFKNKLSGEYIIYDNNSFLVKLDIDSLYQTSLGFYGIFKAGKFGLIDSVGNVVITPQYSNLRQITSSQFIVGSEDGDKLINISDNSITTLNRDSNRQKYPQFDQFDNFTNSLIKVRIGARYGCISKDSSIVIPIIYNKINFFATGLVIGTLNGYKSIIDDRGRIIIPPKYHDISRFKTNLFKVVLDNKCALVDSMDNIIFSFIYNDILPGNLTSYIVKDNSLFGVVNPEGKIEIPFEYQKIEKFGNKLYKARLRGRLGLIDLTNKIEVPFEYQEIEKFPNTLCKVRKDNKFGLIDQKNNIIIPIDYQNIFKFKKNIFKIKNNNQFGLIDSENNLIVPIEYQDILRFSHKFYKVKKKGLYGLIDSDNEIIIPIFYSNIFKFVYSDELFMIKKGGYRGVVDEMNTDILTPIYDDIRLNDYGVFEVTKNNKEGIIDKNGKIILDVRYNDININRSRFDGQKRYIVYEKNNCGVYSLMGKEIIRPLYEKITEIDDNLFLVVNDESKSGLIDKNNNIATSIDFDKIEINKNDTFWALKDDKIFFITRILDSPNASFQIKKYTWFNKSKMPKPPPNLKSN